jgi:cyclophilin family peptidyl-prolyl cis-trans isomerase
MKRLVKLYFSLFITLFIALIFVNNISLNAQADDNTLVLLETTYGDIKIKFYDETPFHKENFLKLVSEKLYDDQIFHRVINNFMIQAGDPNSKNAKPGQPLGYGDLGYTIPAEFNKNLFHKKGALAAARQPDNVNPAKESSASQFYIVHGKVYTDKELDLMEQRGVHIKFTEEQRKIYTSVGGTPHLDYSYTVFGEVIEGIDVVDKIASVKTDQRDRPLNDIKIKIKTIN